MFETAETEASTVLRHSAHGRPDDAILDVRHAQVPIGSVPIYDRELDAIIGYSLTSRGWIIIYNVNGDVVDRHEQGLESPWFSPLDLIFVLGALGRAAVRGAIGVGERTILRGGAGSVFASVLTTPAGGILRMSFRTLYLGELRFTATTAAHMAAAGRFVPIHILRLAIRHGARHADPQSVAGAVR